jgi:hypothetical protein
VTTTYRHKRPILFANTNKAAGVWNLRVNCRFSGKSRQSLTVLLPVQTQLGVHHPEIWPSSTTPKPATRTPTCSSTVSFTRSSSPYFSRLQTPRARWWFQSSPPPPSTLRRATLTLVTTFTALAWSMAIKERRTRRQCTATPLQLPQQ